MLSKESLHVLQQTCTLVASINWDGRIEVEQNESGALTFQSFSEENELEAVLRAEPYGHASLDEKVLLWRFTLQGDLRYSGGDCPVGNLIPQMIVGLLGL